MCDSEAKAPVVMASPSVTELSDINGAADHAAENTHDEASSQTLDVNVHAEATANVTEDATFSDVEVDTASVQKKKNRRKRHGQKGGKNGEIPASNVINVTKVVDLSAPNLAQKQREASNVEALKQGLYLFVGFLCNQLTNPTLWDLFCVTRPDSQIICSVFGHLLQENLLQTQHLPHFVTLDPLESLWQCSTQNIHIE